MPHLDRRLEAKRATAVRTRVALPRLAEVAEARFEVAPGLAIERIIDLASVTEATNLEELKAAGRALV